MKKLIAVLLLACMLTAPVIACADGLFGDIVGGMFGGNEFENEDFNEKMKALESFYDEYIAFMKKYSKNPTDAALLADYGKMLSRYSDASKALDSIDESKLTEKEQQTYLKTLARIDQKLLSAGLSMGG